MTSMLAVKRLLLPILLLGLLPLPASSQGQGPAMFRLARVYGVCQALLVLGSATQHGRAC
jgi:hypothetical protein